MKYYTDNKATGLDGIGIKPLKKALNATAPSLTHIYNASIASGSIPDNFKRAKLTPVHKNNSIHDRNNYRSISILLISKPLERHVARSYLDYLTSNTLLHSKQSAYRPYHSCETALLNFTDNWLKAIWARKNLSARYYWTLVKLLIWQITAYFYQRSVCTTLIIHICGGLSLTYTMDHCLTHYQLLDYMITKLNSRVNLLKSARKYLNLSLRNLLYNALIKPMFEYCC